MDRLLYSMGFSRTWFLFLLCIQVIVIVIFRSKQWHLPGRNVLLRPRMVDVEVQLESKKVDADSRALRQSLYMTDDHWKGKSGRETQMTVNYGGKTDFQTPSEEEEFIENWCRIQEARTNWRRLLMPCINDTVWGWNNHSNFDKQTNGNTSYIALWDLQPAGRFSRFFIQSISRTKERKTTGGDSWRVHLRGPAVLAPTVFDLRNGVYEVLFLIMEPGRYKAEIYLDYTLCSGFKDPPPYWFKSGNSQGKNQPDGILMGDKPFLIEEFRQGEVIEFDIMAQNKQNDIENITKTVHCSCHSLLWDGLGRWVNGIWQPYVKTEPVRYKRPTTKGALVIFGDSVASGFYGYIQSSPHHICSRVFSSCRIVYNWVYNMRGYWGNGVTSPREPIPDGKDYDAKRVLDDVREVLYAPHMDEYSVLILNWGIHFAAAVNFTSYQTLIKDFVRIIKHGEKDLRTGSFRKFRGKLIWKTTTAINRQRFPNPHKDVRRFLTFPRVLLYNAFATSVMCQAGIDVIDVYPITDAYPKGTMSKVDPVHYGNHVFSDVRRRMFEMFKP